MGLILEEHFHQDLRDPEDSAFKGGHFVQGIEQSLAILLENVGEDGNLALIMLVPALPQD